MRHRAALLASLAAVVGIAAATSSATRTRGNGPIAFEQFVGGRYQLFTVGADGRGKRQITHVAGNAMKPDWSPDGTLIAFTHERSVNNASVALISPRGTGLHELTPAASGRPKSHMWEGDAAFTPDGKQLVFVRNSGPTDSGIWVMRKDGSHLRRLTKNPFMRNWTGGDIDPNVSADGKLVSFVRIKNAKPGPGYKNALFVVPIGGGAPRQLTPYALDVASKHAWSPDGKLIVLSTNAHFVRPADSANLATIRPDGSHLTELTHFAHRKQNAYAGSFSPDGRRIVFRLEQGVSCQPGDRPAKGCRYALAVLGADGQNLRLLTSLARINPPRYIAWCPAS